MNSYQSELGQAAFGQPPQALECPVGLEAAISAMAELWDVFKGEPNPFCNSGHRHDGEHIRIHAYSWNDEEEQEFNLAWSDLRVSWYKYFGRGMSCNREPSEADIRQMVRDFIAEVTE